MKSLLFILLLSISFSIAAQRPDFHPQMKKEFNLPVTPFKPSSSLMTPSDIGNPPSVNWVRQMEGDGNDVANAVVTDASGNVFVTGTLSGPVNFGSASLTSVGYKDAFIAKFNSAGALQWVRQLSCGPSEMSFGRAIALDLNNNIYITGYFNGSTLKVGNVTLTRTGIQDLFIAKYDQEGNLLMANHHGEYDQAIEGLKIAADTNQCTYILSGHKTILKFNQDGTAEWTYQNGANFYDICVNNNNIYLTGNFQATVAFGDSNLYTPGYSYAPFIAKCTTDGIFQWAVKGVTTSHACAYSIFTDADENVYISGRFQIKLILGGIQLLNPQGTYTPFFAKCNSAGTFLFAKNIVITGDSYSLPSLTSLSGDEAGNCRLSIELMGGTFEFAGSTFDSPGWYILNYDTAGNEILSVKKDGIINSLGSSENGKLIYAGSMSGDVMLAKCNVSNYSEWTWKSAGNSGSSQICNMKTDKSGNLYMYGITELPSVLSGNSADPFLAKLKPNGDKIWSLACKGGDSDYYGSGSGNFIALDPKGNIDLMGAFTDTLLIGDKMLINNNGNRVLFIARISSEGDPLWVKQIGSGTFSQRYSVTPDYSGNMIVTGTFSDSIIIGNDTLTSLGYDDAFIAKFDSQGNILWAKRTGGEDYEYMVFASTDSLDNIYFTGEFPSRNCLIDDLQLNLTQYDGDILLAKFSPEGITQWAYTIGGDPGGDDTGRRWNCWPVAIKTTSKGDSYLYGWTGKKNNYGPFLLESPSNYNFYLLKTDITGSVQWAKIIQERTWGWHSMDIDIDNEGSVYFGGNLSDSVFFQNTVVVPSEGSCDLFTGKYKKDGTLDWVKVFEGNSNTNPGFSIVSGIAVYDQTSIYIGGCSIYKVKFDTTILNSSNYDGFYGLLGAGITNVEEHSTDESGISVYPNPASSFINIVTSDQNLKITGISIADVQGRVIFEQNGKFGSKHRVDVNNMKPGIYILSVTTNKGTERKKVLVE